MRSSLWTTSFFYVIIFIVGDSMNGKNNDIVEKISYIFSPFFDDKDSLEIKEFVRKIRKSPEFSKMKINIVQFNHIRGKFKLNRNNKTHLIREFIRPSVGGCYSKDEDKIFIYVDNYVRPIRISKSEKNNSFSRIVQGIFHEYRHRCQYSLNHNETFNLIFCDISRLVMEYRGKFKYLLEHDSFFIEIDANNYGVSKAIEYFEEHQEMAKYSNKRDLDIHRLMYDYDECVYDFDKEFTYYNIIRETVANDELRQKIKRDKNKRWHKVFYGNKKRLKTIYEIINHEDFAKVDDRFINYVFTSRYFNKLLDYSTISDDIKKRLLYEFKIRKEELLLKIDFVHNNRIETGERRINDMKRMVNDLNYYDHKIFELSSLLSKRKLK